jgi:hypothetical protein
MKSLKTQRGKSKDRQHNDQKKKDRQHNDQKKKDKRTNNDLQNNSQKTKDRATLKTSGELGCSGRVSSSCSTSAPVFMFMFRYFLLFTAW